MSTGSGLLRFLMVLMAAVATRPLTTAWVSADTGPADKLAFVGGISGCLCLAAHVPILLQQAHPGLQRR